MILLGCSLVGVVIDVVSLILLSKPALIRVDRRLLDDPRLGLLVDIDIVVRGCDTRSSSALMLLSRCILLDLDTEDFKFDESD